MESSKGNNIQKHLKVKDFDKTIKSLEAFINNYKDSRIGDSYAAVLAKVNKLKDESNR